jgi:ribosomal RNA-processing protein 12
MKTRAIQICTLKMLSFPFWFQVLNLLTTFFEVCGSEYHGLTGRCLKSLAELRSSANFSLTNELDYVVGRAVRTMGPEVVLSYIPLQINGTEESYDFPMSWLLPVLRENIQNANLCFFKAHFLPMAEACKIR